jgi:competence CoiA-like predicted nuclease
MSHNLSLGAINKITNEYVYPKIANKKDNYICHNCNKDLILCKGKIISPYFRHKADSINPCYYYDKPSESQIHKDAKMLMEKLLKNKTPIQITRKCISCTNDIEINLPKIKEGSIISIEYRFKYNDNTRIADVAHTFNNEIKAIYEICYKNQTNNENRPEPWVEIDAISLINIVNTNENNLLKINCIRTHQKCNYCIDIEIEKQKNIEYEKIKKIKSKIIEELQNKFQKIRQLEFEKIREL